MVNIEEVIDEGGVHFQAILEMVGKPKDHVTKSFADYIESIKKDEQFTVVSCEIAETVENEDSESMFSTFCEMEVVAKKLVNAYDFVFKYMPASIEMIAPEKYSLQSGDFSNLLNDFIAKMHVVDMDLKKANQKIRVLGTNLNVLTSNMILMLVKSKPLPLDGLSKYTGVEEKQLEQLLNLLIEQKKLKKEGDLFALA